MSLEKTKFQQAAEKILKEAREKEIADALAGDKTPDAKMLHDALVIYGDFKTAKRILERMKQDLTVSPLQATFDYANKFLGKNWVQDLRAASKTADSAPHSSVRRSPRESAY